MVKVCYLIGYPLGHSMSHVMHNAAFRELSLDYRFELLEIPPRELKPRIESDLRPSWVRGASVTIPHKIEVLRHLEEVDPSAAKIGAVNTIVNERGILKGYNTDGAGAMKSLEKNFGDLEGVKAVVLGAGGASRAISYHLSQVAGELVILNRTYEKAQSLAETLMEYPECKAPITAKPMNRASIREDLRDAELLVNTTPLGMWPRTSETPVEGELIRPGIMVFDIIYNPPKTRLLEEAEASGARTLNGVEMLIYQGAEAFRLWTGREAPIETMRKALEEALGVRG